MKRISYLIFALLDIGLIIMYFYVQMNDQRIPILSDFQQVLELAKSYGGDDVGGVWFIYIMYLPFSVYAISLLISIVCYLKQSVWTKWVVLGQFPLRLLCVSSTIPAFIAHFKYFIESFISSPTSLIIVFVTLVITELAKVIYIFKLK